MFDSLFYIDRCFWMNSWGLFQKYSLSSDWNRFIFVSSDQITRFQSSTVQCLRFLQNSRGALIFLLDKAVFSTNTIQWSALRAVHWHTFLPISIAACLNVFEEFSFILSNINWVSKSLSNLGRSPEFGLELTFWRFRTVIKVLWLIFNFRTITGM